MKNILILLATFFLSSCICLLACKDFNYEIKRDLEVENLSPFWKVKSFNNARFTVIYPWYSIYIYNMPSNIYAQGCDLYPEGLSFDFSFKNISDKGAKFAPETLFDNRKVYVINNGKKTYLKLNKKYFQTWKPGVFGVWNYDESKYIDGGDFSFKIPCEVVITPDTIIHIGGIIENGKELPPIEFKVYKKGTYDTESAS